MDGRDEERGARRARIRTEIAAGDVTGLKVLAERLETQGIHAEPDELRADVRALGAIRVQHGEGSAFAIPVDAPPSAAPTPTPKLVADVVTDPDWKLQVGVVAVVALFLLVAFIGWLIG